MDVLHVCTACRYSKDEPSLDGKRGGQLLYDRLLAATELVPLEVRSVDCLSVCSKNCVVAFTAETKTTLVFASLDVKNRLDVTIEALITFGASYAQSIDGFFLRRQRPFILQDKLHVRVPPAPRLARSDWPICQT